MKKIIILPALVIVGCVAAMEHVLSDTVNLVYLVNNFPRSIVITDQKMNVLDVLSSGEKKKVNIPFERTLGGARPTISILEKRGIFQPQGKNPIALLTIPAEKNHTLIINSQMDDPKGKAKRGEKQVAVKMFINNSSDELVWAFNGDILKEIKPKIKEQFVGFMVEALSEDVWQPIYFLTELNWYQPSGTKRQFVLTITNTGGIKSVDAEEYFAQEESEQTLKAYSQEREPEVGLIKKYEEMGLFKGVVNDGIKKSIIKYMQAKFGDKLDHELVRILSDPRQRRILVWEGIGTHFGLDAFYASGFVHFYANNDDPKPLLKGLPHGFSLEQALGIPDVNEKAKKLKNEIMEHVVQNYKIHLMPSDRISLTNVLQQIIIIISLNPELQNVIYGFKIKPDVELRFDSDRQLFPIIVFYPSAGKESAQKALNLLFKEFNDRFPGLGKSPRYNAKVSNLIYVAQGDGDFKGDMYKKWYDADRVYFRADITGKKRDYVLKYPNTGKRILGDKERQINVGRRVIFK